MPGEGGGPQWGGAPWSQAFLSMVGVSSLLAVGRGVPSPTACRPAPGPGITAQFTSFLLALPAGWLWTDFLPNTNKESKARILLLGLLPGEEPIPSQQGTEKPIPRVPLPAKCGKSAGYLWAMQDGDLGAPGLRSEPCFRPGTGVEGGRRGVHQHWREGVRCTEPGRLGILRQRRLSQRQSSSRRKVSRKALLQSA